MAIFFDELDDYFIISDHDSLTLPATGWAIGVWTKVDDNSGSGFQYILSNGAYTANGTFHLFLREAGAANPDAWAFRINDDDGTQYYDRTSATPGGDGKWRLLVFQFETSIPQLQLWFCEPGQTAAKEGQTPGTNFDAVNGGDWHIGRRQVDPTDRWYGSAACEIWKGNFTLTQDEITALGAGMPAWALGYPLDLYLPMHESVATLKDLIGGNDAVRQSAPTTVEHAPVRLWLGPWVVAAPPPGVVTLSISTSDSITVSESVGLSISALALSTSDSTSLSDSPACSVQSATTRSLAVSDSITVTESIDALLVALVSVSDNTTVTESVTLATSTLIFDISDSVGTAEDVTCSVLSAAVRTFSVSDSSTITESVSLTISTLTISISDSITVTENVGILGIFLINVSDSTTVAESVTNTLPDALALSRSETVTVTENVGVSIGFAVSVSDAISASENVNVSVQTVGLLSVSVSDSMGTSESVNVFVKGATLQVAIVWDDLSLWVQGVKVVA